jgi:dihydroorotase (multifunctional complex type)
LSLDLAVLNGTVVDEHGFRPLDIGIRAGRIALLAAPGALPPAREQIDARDGWVLPGIVDAHFHCRAPEAPEREDFASGTAAAASSGVTTLFEMPIAEVGVSRPEIWLDRMTLADRDAYIDFGLFGGCGTLDRDAILGQAAAGAIGFKIFMHRPPPGRSRQFQGLSLTSEHELLTALSLVRETGLLTAVHAESDALLDSFRQRAERAGTGGLALHAAAHDPAAEAMAVSWLAVLAEATGARVHVVHVTSAWAADVIRAARRRGAPLSGETCPQYLLFNEELAQPFGIWAKVAPPIRSAADQSALWAALQDGTLSFIASDHAPFTPDDKMEPDPSVAPSGLPCIEAMVPLLLSVALGGRIPLPQMLRLLTAEPARHYGIYPQKGALLPGSDADLVIFDPAPTVSIDTRRWFSRSRGSARMFDGLSHQGQIRRTMVRGNTVFLDGQLVGLRGAGRLVRPGHLHR